MELRTGRRGPSSGHGGPVMILRQAQGPEELEAVFRFRYEHYFHRFTAGYPGVDHARRRVFEPHDLDSIHSCAFDDQGGLLGVSTATPAACPDMPPAWRDWFDLDRLSPLDPARTVISTRLVLHPKVRQTGLYGQFHGYIIASYVQAGFLNALHYCRPDLVCRFESLGHRRYGQVFNLPGGQYRVSMLMAFTDPDHLSRVGAPIWSLLEHDLPRPEPEALLAVLPELASLPNFRLLTPGERLDYVLARLTPQAAACVPPEASAALEHASPLPLFPGQSLMPTAGDSFLAFILSGSAREGGADFSPGDFIGAKPFASAFPVQALEPGEMLVFESSLAHALARSLPAPDARPAGLWRFLGLEGHAAPGHIARSPLPCPSTRTQEEDGACGTPLSTVNAAS